MSATFDKTKNDVKVLVDDAQQLFDEASAATGQKAEELRAKGAAVLDKAVAAARRAQSAAIEASKELASSTDALVKENPWKAIAISGTVGLLLGCLIARK